VLFPALFALDMLWALSPFLIYDRLGLGLALGSAAALIYMPFVQRGAGEDDGKGTLATRPFSEISRQSERSL